MWKQIQVQRVSAMHLLTILAALIVVAASCSSSSGEADDDDSGADSTEASASEDVDQDEAAGEDSSGDGDDSDAELTASFRGVTETEMHIGITMIDFDELKDFNLANEGWGDQQAVYQVFIDDLNDRGGIHGRTVIPHFEYYSVLTAAAAEEKCTALTQDVETFVVLGGFNGPAEVANNCIVSNNETIMIGGQQTRERLDAAKAPWVGEAILRDDRLPIFLQLLADNGFADDVELAVVGSVEQKEIFDASGDILAEFGIDPVLSIQNDVPQGDLTATDTRWQVLAENVRASGANTVLVIGSGQGALRGIKNNGLDVAVWVLEDNDLQNLGSETTPDHADGAVTISQLTYEQQFEDPLVQSQCYEPVVAAIPEVDVRHPELFESGEERWFQSIFPYCRRMMVFEMLATAAGPNPTQESFQDAMDNLGDFSLPGMPFASLEAAKPYTQDTAQLTRFDVSSGENGGLVPITEPADTTP